MNLLDLGKWDKLTYQQIFTHIDEHKMYISFRESTEGEVRPPRPYMTISTSEAVQGLINEAIATESMHIFRQCKHEEMARAWFMHLCLQRLVT